MTQICTNIADVEFKEIVKQADDLGISKGKRTAELITYALNVDKELEHKDEFITQLKEELGFLRSSYSILQQDIAQPLTKLLPEVTETKRGFWQRIRGR